MGRRRMGEGGEARCLGSRSAESNLSTRQGVEKATHIQRSLRAIAKDLHLTARLAQLASLQTTQAREHTRL
jgi:hypothetical protein